MNGKRLSTVESVFGAITQFMGLKKLIPLVYLTAALKRKYVAIEDMGKGIWKVFFRNVFLGFFNESNIRNKQVSIRLSQNMV